jgi:hypothetical protein
MVKDELDFDPENIFEEGRSLGQEETDEAIREQLASDLISAGQDVDEVEALLFDPAPRRKGSRKRGKINCSPRQRATMPQICKGSRSRRKYAPARPMSHRFNPVSGSYYDPAPRRSVTAKRTGGKRPAKGLIAGLKPLVLPAATLATIYMKYTDRATKLTAAGALNKDGTPVKGVFDAIMYDLQNRPTTKVIDRVKAQAGSIVAPALIGVATQYTTKKIKMNGKLKQAANLGAEGLIGMGIGNLINAILDPPDPVGGIKSQAGNVIQMVPAAQQTRSSTPSYIPYGFGGY